jgi:hypothetical protein
LKTFEIRPLIGVGPVRFAMTCPEVRAALGKPSHVRTAHTLGSVEFPETDYFFRNSFQVTYDAEGTVEFIELGKYYGFVATYEGVDLLRVNANEAVALVARKAAIDESDGEYPMTVIFPELELSLWRECRPEDDPAGIDGRQFSAVGLGRVGYRSRRRG